MRTVLEAPNCFQFYGRYLSHLALLQTFTYRHEAKYIYGQLRRPRVPKTGKQICFPQSQEQPECMLIKKLLYAI